MDDKPDDRVRRETQASYTLLDPQFVSLVLRHHEPLPLSLFSEEASDEPVWQAVEAERETYAKAEG